MNLYQQQEMPSQQQKSSKKGPAKYLTVGTNPILVTLVAKTYVGGFLEKLTMAPK